MLWKVVFTLQQLQLEKLQAQPAPDQLPDLNEGADTDNEFVKQYLEQRQLLFKAQKEARRKLEGECVVLLRLLFMLPFEKPTQLSTVCRSKCQRYQIVTKSRLVGLEV